MSCHSSLASNGVYTVPFSVVIFFFTSIATGTKWPSSLHRNHHCESLCNIQAVHLYSPESNA